MATPPHAAWIAWLLFSQVLWANLAASYVKDTSIGHHMRVICYAVNDVLAWSCAVINFTPVMHKHCLYRSHLFDDMGLFASLSMGNNHCPTVLLFCPELSPFHLFDSLGACLGSVIPELVCVLWHSCHPCKRRKGVLS